MSGQPKSVCFVICYRLASSPVTLFCQVEFTLGWCNVSNISFCAPAILPVLEAQLKIHCLTFSKYSLIFFFHCRIFVYNSLLVIRWYDHITWWKSYVLFWTRIQKKKRENSGSLLILKRHFHDGEWYKKRQLLQIPSTVYLSINSTKKIIWNFFDLFLWMCAKG